MSTAEKVGQILQPGIPAPTVNETPEKSILKKRYLERSNRGQPQPLPSNDNYSAGFQLNMSANSIESVDYPECDRIIPSNLLREQNANFGHCVSSDLAMSAGNKPHFVRLFLELLK